MHYLNLHSLFDFVFHVSFIFTLNSSLLELEAQVQVELEVEP